MVEDTISKVAKEVVKPRIEWSDLEKKLAQANAKTYLLVWMRSNSR